MGRDCATCKLKREQAEEAKTKVKLAQVKKTKPIFRVGIPSDELKFSYTPPEQSKQLRPTDQLKSQRPRFSTYANPNHSSFPRYEYIPDKFDTTSERKNSYHRRSTSSELSRNPHIINRTVGKYSFPTYNSFKASSFNPRFLKDADLNRMLQRQNSFDHAVGSRIPLASYHLKSNKNSRQTRSALNSSEVSPTLRQRLLDSSHLFPSKLPQPSLSRDSSSSRCSIRSLQTPSPLLQNMKLYRSQSSLDWVSHHNYNSTEFSDLPFAVPRRKIRKPLPLNELQEGKFGLGSLFDCSQDDIRSLSPCSTCQHDDLSLLEESSDLSSVQNRKWIRSLCDLPGGLLLSESLFVPLPDEVLEECFKATCIPLPVEFPNNCFEATCEPLPDDNRNECFVASCVKLPSSAPEECFEATCCPLPSEILSECFLASCLPLPDDKQSECFIASSYPLPDDHPSECFIASCCYLPEDKAEDCFIASCFSLPEDDSSECFLASCTSLPVESKEDCFEATCKQLPEDSNSECFIASCYALPDDTKEECFIASCIKLPYKKTECFIPSCVKLPISSPKECFEASFIPLPEEANSECFTASCYPLPNEIPSECFIASCISLPDDKQNECFIASSYSLPDDHPSECFIASCTSLQIENDSEWSTNSFCSLSEISKMDYISRSILHQEPDSLGHTSELVSEPPSEEISSDLSEFKNKDIAHKFEELINPINLMDKEKSNFELSSIDQLSKMPTQTKSSPSKILHDNINTSKESSGLILKNFPEKQLNIEAKNLPSLRPLTHAILALVSLHLCIFILSVILSGDINIEQFSYWCKEITRNFILLI